MQAAVRDADFPSDPIPQPKFRAARAGRIERRRKQESAFASRLSLENAPGLGIEGDLSRTRLGVAEDKHVGGYFRPAQLHDLTPAAPGQEEKPDDVGLLPEPFSPPGLLAERLMKAADLFPGQKACQCRTPVLFYSPRGVGVDETEGDGEIHNLPEQLESMVGVARGGPAECFEPAPDLGGGNAVDWLGTERRQELPSQNGSHALSGRRLVAVEMCFLPGPSTKSRNSGAARVVRASLPVRDLPFADGIPDEPPRRFQGHRTQRDALRATVGLLQQDVAPPAGWSDPDPEARHPAVPDRVFRSRGRRRAMAASVSLAFSGPARSALQRGADRFGGLVNHGVGQMGILRVVSGLR